MQKSSLRKKQKNFKCQSRSSKVPSCWHNLFRDKQLYKLTSSRFSKQILCEGKQFWWNLKYKIDCLPKIAQLNGITFGFIPHLCYFSYHPSIAASEVRSLITFFFTKMRGRKHSHKNINIPVFQIFD